MAERRMMSKKIVDSDAFMDMPLSTQALYFHLLARADDDGFVGNPKKIMKMVGANDDDFKVLITKRFVLQFPSGVCVIKHWMIHNYIQNDRYNETQYLDEKKQLEVKENKSYTECIQNGYKVDTQVSIGKVSIGKVRDMSAFNQFWIEYPKKTDKKSCEMKWKSKNLDASVDKILAFIKKAKDTDRWKKGYVKNPLTFLNGENWEDDLSGYNDTKQNIETINL